MRRQREVDFNLVGISLLASSESPKKERLLWCENLLVG
jgi:hypothetical protein